MLLPLLMLQYDTNNRISFREDDDDVVEVPVFDVDEEQDASAIFGDLVRRCESANISGDVAAEADDVRVRFRAVCDLLKKFNNELIKTAQDRKFRFQVTKLFHGRANSRDDDAKWDQWSDDDDALVVVTQNGVEKTAIGNIYEIIVLNQAPTNKHNLTAGNSLRNGRRRARVPLDFQPDKVVMLMRIYKEVDGDGKVLEGFGNPKHQFYHMPLHCEMAPDYWLSESLLGHVRLKPLLKIKRKNYDRMYKEEVASDRKDLLDQYHAQGSG
jgi:hypothetical protein